MQKSLEATRVHPEVDAATVRAALAGSDATDIDPMTLAKLDIGLFRCLQNLGTSQQRICSALCLSYAEYDYISRLLNARQ